LRILGMLLLGRGRQEAIEKLGKHFAASPSALGLSLRHAREPRVK